MRTKEGLDMDYRRAEAMTRSLTRDGGVLDYGSVRSRLLVRVLQTLADGRAVTPVQVDEIVDLLEMGRNEARVFLRTLTERDASDNIIGVLGLSLGDHPHRFFVNGRRMTTWCAMDTLFLPALLRRTAVIESTSPLSRETVRLSVGPSGVESVSPAGAVVSMVILDPDKADLKIPRRHVANVLPSRQLLRIPDRSGTVGRQAT
jgi:hypothetical protein